METTVGREFFLVKLDSLLALRIWGHEFHACIRADRIFGKTEQWKQKHSTWMLRKIGIKGDRIGGWQKPKEYPMYTLK